MPRRSKTPLKPSSSLRRHPRKRLEQPPSPTQADAWSKLRQFTAARIGLARSGASLATAPLLEFRLAHARARDAVGESLDEARLAADLAVFELAVLLLASAAESRRHYLLRPDLGRRLASDAAAALAPHAGDHDVAVVVADGLSARAVATHARPVLAEVLPVLRGEGWRVAPLTIVRNGRVAIGDVVAVALCASMVVMLIGERPGLSASDSMGAYLTWQPGPRTTDAQRNCVSNVRPEGLGYADAGRKIVQLLRAMKARRVSGVLLKDDADGRLIV